MHYGSGLTWVEEVCTWFLWWQSHFGRSDSYNNKV